MADIANLIIAFMSIALGAIGWFAPRYTMRVLDTAPTGSTMGLSEIRAASGALFVGLGVAAVLIGTPTGFVMLAAAWGGAAAGRLTSLVLDGYTPRKLGFFVTECAVAGTGLAINIV